MFLRFLLVRFLLLRIFFLCSIFAAGVGVFCKNSLARNGTTLDFMHICVCLVFLGSRTNPQLWHIGCCKTPSSHSCLPHSRSHILLPCHLLCPLFFMDICHWMPMSLAPVSDCAL